MPLKPLWPTALSCAVLTLAALQPVRAEAPPPADPQVQALVQLLEKIQGDPAQLGALIDSLGRRAEELRKGAAPADSPELAELGKRLDAARAELGELEKSLPALREKSEGAQARRAEAERQLGALEKTLDLLKSIHTEAKPADLPAAHLEPHTISYSHEIRPLLANYCFKCHGFDDKARKAGLRLDDPAIALVALKSGKVPITPGDRSKSAVMSRLLCPDESERMPPKETNKKVKPEEIELIGMWIDQGAKYEKHWAFVKPERPELPSVKNKDWERNEIDAFVLARLEREGLTPSPEADKRTLIRRATFDLTGLPPKPADVEAFASDPSPGAYEKLLDRLFDTSEYAEHMTRQWLDVARYADTNGYHIDNIRYMWPWRDWVIRSFRKHQPYDQFTVEQLAGDLLPKATLDQRIASGFNRNHMINFEGGAIPDEYRVNYIIDRVNTTGATWLGLTVNCTQCHSHKYDPITHKEFYKLFSFFAKVPEEGLDGREGNSVPRILLPDASQADKLDGIRAELARLDSRLNGPDPEQDFAQSLWEKKNGEAAAKRWALLNPLEVKSSAGIPLKKLDDKSILAGGDVPEFDNYEFVAFTGLKGLTALRLEALTDDSLPKKGVGRADNGNFLLGEFEVDAVDPANPDAATPVKFVAADADYSQKDFEVSRAIDGDPKSGWAVDGKVENRVAVFIADKPFGYENGTLLRVRLKQGAAHARHAIGRFRLSATNDPAISISTISPWNVSGTFQAASGDEAYKTAYPPEKQDAIDLNATYEDGRRKWLPAPSFADGPANSLTGENCATYLYRVITAPSAREMKIGVGSDDAVKVWLNGKVVIDKNVQRGLKPGEDQATLKLQAGENRVLMKVVNYGTAYAFSFAKNSEQTSDVPLDIEVLLAKGAKARAEKETATLRTYFRKRNMADWTLTETKIAKLTREQTETTKAVATTMVMQDLEKPRDTFVLNRGQYDQPGEKVEAGVPAFLPPLPKDAPANRLGLARWIVDPENPLTARVTVNRFWQQLFGAGIVKTTEDFGTQGDWPSHPELLDWLATEFVRGGWDVRGLQRLIMTSATYRQSSKSTPGLQARDPENRLLAHAPRFRMDAEVVRDEALAVSGLLVSKVGGPSVKPYQPPGLWEEVAYGGKEFTGQMFTQDHGDALFRRSMYTLWKRQAPPPSMTIFDAPSREICVVRRSRTNTPLQALTLMNDPQFVEAARALAQRMIKEAGAAPADRVAFAFELATARKPTGEECSILLDAYGKQLEEFKLDKDAAVKFLSVGESKRDESIDPAELAAWTTVANMILNLDETITKG